MASSRANLRFYHVYCQITTVKVTGTRGLMFVVVLDIARTRMSHHHVAKLLLKPDDFTLFEVGYVYCFEHCLYSENSIKINQIKE